MRNLWVKATLKSHSYALYQHPHEFWAQTNLFDSKNGYEETLFQHLGHPCALIHHQTGLPLNLGQIGVLKGSYVHEYPYEK